MKIISLYIIAATATILLFTGLNLHKIRGYIIFDRIDIHCEIQAVPFAQLSKMQPGEPSTSHRERVIKARLIQEERFKDYKNVHCNAQMTERMLHKYAEPDDGIIVIL